MLFLFVISLNVVATLLNAMLCVWATTKKKQYKYDALLCDASFMLSLVVIAADITYLIIGG